MTTRTTFGLAALAGLGLVLGGCGSSGGGGGGSSGKLAFDGTGTEVLGYWVAEVTSASGLYATNHYAIPGWTQHVYLSEAAGVVDFDGTDLTADPASKSYQGTNTYNLVDGALDGDSITEDVTMAFSGGKVVLTVTGTSGAETGSYKVTLHPIVGPDVFSQDDNYYYGRMTGLSGGPSKIYSPYKGGTAVLELENWNPGTYAYVYWDATYDWVEYPYIDALYLDGNTLKGGGYYSGDYISDSSGWLGDAPGGFVSVSIPLNASGQPSALSFVYSDYEEGVTVKGAANSFVPETKLDSFYPNGPAYDLTVTTVTAGGVLEGEFGVATTVNADSVYSYGYYMYLDSWSAYGGYVSPTERRFEAWEGRYYEYNGTGEPGYEIDGDSTTPERVVWTVTTNPTTGVPTGGTVSLTIYDATFNVTSTESMTFTLTP